MIFSFRGSPLLSPSEKRQLRLRRVRSTSRAQEIVTEEEKQRRAQPDKPYTYVQVIHL